MCPTCIGLATFGDRIVDDKRSRRRRLRHAQPLNVRARRGQLRGEPIVLEPQIDEARPGNFRRLAQLGHVERSHKLRRNLPRRLAQPLAQRHRAVRLVVAKLRILTRQHQRSQARQIGRRRCRASSDARANRSRKSGEDVHLGKKRV